MQQLVKYTFSGHDSFQCRLLWLKKGYDYLLASNSFANDHAPVKLGVGSNMVRSIRYWLRAFGLTDEREMLSELAHVIFAGDSSHRQNGPDELSGFDPFLEDQATLWLLHYQLIKTRHASTYWIIFNELRRRRPEFSSDDFVHYVTRVKAETEKFSAHSGTVGDDFRVFTKLYIQSGRQAKDREEGFAGILTELNILKPIERRSEDGKSSFIYAIPLTERDDLPAELLLYCLLDSPNLGMSISLETLETEPGMPCMIFAMNRAGLLRKIEQLTARYPSLLTYSDQAGVRELQFREKPTDKYQILHDYYAPTLV